MMVMASLRLVIGATAGIFGPANIGTVLLMVSVGNDFAKRQMLVVACCS